MSIILAFEQGGNALRLINQNNGYISLVYQPRAKLARCLHMYEETCFTEARDAFDRELRALKALGHFAERKAA